MDYKELCELRSYMERLEHLEYKLTHVSPDPLYAEGETEGFRFHLRERDLWTARGDISLGQFNPGDVVGLQPSWNKRQWHPVLPGANSHKVTLAELASRRQAQTQASGNDIELKELLRRIANGDVEAMKEYKQLLQN